jgi:hypothetical protein
VLASVLAVGLATGASGGVTIIVDDDGPADFRTINDALDFAKAVVPDGERVIIRVQPGDYREQLVIDRSNSSLVAESEPLFDGDGYLAGYGKPVTVFVRKRLRVGEDVVRITADRVEFRGFLVSGGGRHPQDRLNAGVRVTGHVPGTVGERIVRGALVSQCEVAGIGDTSFWFQAAAGRLERCRTVDLSYLDANVTGADFDLGTPPLVRIVKNVFGSSEANICLIGQAWELGEGPTHGPGGHQAVVDDNLLLDASHEVFGFFRGHNFLMLLRGFHDNSHAGVRGLIEFEFRGNILGGSSGAAIHAIAGEEVFPDATGLIKGCFRDNSFLPGLEPELAGEFSMALVEPPGEYAHNHRFIFRDPQGLFSGAVQIDEGPPENGNRIVIIPSDDD